MSVMGIQVDVFSVPVCSRFRPVLLQGQLCYQVEANGMEVNKENNRKSQELIIVLDYNEDRMASTVVEDKNLENKNNEKEHDAMVYIHTLG